MNFKTMNFKTILKPKSKSYPRLMISTYSGSIYLMTNQTSGTKLTQGASGINKNTPIGTYSIQWDDDELIDYEGKVIFKTIT